MFRQSMMRRGPGLLTGGPRAAPTTQSTRAERPQPPERAKSEGLPESAPDPSPQSNPDTC